MSKKSKGVVLDSTAPYGIGVYEDAKARLKYQTLMQDYEELQKEADVMKSKLEASKQRKLMLAAEVRFLRKRREYLVKTKTTNSFKEQSPVEAPGLLKRAKITKEQALIGKEASLKKKLAPLSDGFPVSDQPRKKKIYGGKEAKGHSLSLISTQVSDLNHKGMKHTRKEVNTTPISDRNPKERMFGANDATVRNSTAAFDLNQDTAPSEREASLPTRAPIFDLNEISTGDEDFQSSVELEEARKSLMRGMNEEQQNDVKLSVCRNAGESSSRGGKRKISWQDPVALRV